MTHRILFVCMGNICRSPAGEGILSSLIKQQERQHQFHIDSAGTIGFHAGKPADARMRQAASTRGYALTSQSRQIRANDLDEFDLVIAMDRDNLRDLVDLAGKPQDHIQLLSEFLDESWPRDVPDPYYGGLEGFDYVLDMIEAACPKILARFITS